MKMIGRGAEGEERGWEGVERESPYMEKLGKSLVSILTLTVMECEMENILGFFGRMGVAWNKGGCLFS